MTAFSLPVFSRLSPKIARAERELAQMIDFHDRHAAQAEQGDWGALSALSSGIHNVYNGMEDILFSLSRDIDGAVPTGASAHQDLLDQMAAPIQGIRPALLDPRLYDALTELKGFRHLVRHRYGFDLKPDKVIENLLLLRSNFAAFLEAVVKLERIMRENGP